MSFRKLARAVLIGLGVFAVIYLLASQFLGPGVGDFTKSIKNGYYYSYAGGYERRIGYSGNKTSEGGVIDSRVDKYIVRDDTIYVARTPRIAVRGDDGVLRSELVRNCEYWRIDTIMHEVTKLNSKPKMVGLRCN